MKYLEVQFDRHQGFTEHVDQLVIKVRKAIAAMRVMAAANWVAYAPYASIPLSGSFGN